jgi:hypothetical protein
MHAVLLTRPGKLAEGNYRRLCRWTLYNGVHVPRNSIWRMKDEASNAQGPKDQAVHQEDLSPVTPHQQKVTNVLP